MLVKDCMTRHPVMAPPTMMAAEAEHLMHENRIRHLPVVEDGKLLGLISIGDLVNWVMHSQRHTILQLQGYIAGDYPG